jgi:hypothetical protein
MGWHGLLPPPAPFFTQEMFRGIRVIRGKLLKDLVKKTQFYRIALQRGAQSLPSCHCKLQIANCKLPSVDRKMLIGLNA